MARVYVVESHQFGVERGPIVVVDCLSDANVFDIQHAEEQAKKLKDQTEAAAVVVQLGEKFWVV